MGDLCVSDPYLMVGDPGFRSGDPRLCVGDPFPYNVFRIILSFFFIAFLLKASSACDIFQFFANILLRSLSGLGRICDVFRELLTDF